MATQPNEKTAIFVVVDLPRDGPFKTWQKFKDVARTALKNGHKPGWTEVKSKADGSALGYTLCKTREDANLIYDHLLERGCFAGVHLYDTGRRKDHPMICTCPTELHHANYDYYRHHVQFLAHYQSAPAPYVGPTSPVKYSPPIPWAGPAVPLLSESTHLMTAEFQNLGLSQQYYPPVVPDSANYYPVQPIQAFQAPHTSTYTPAMQYPSGYAFNSQGLPVNTQGGVVRSERNVIVLKNLDPAVTEQELHTVLGKTVSPVTLDIKRSPDSKKKSISAIATYRDNVEVRRVTEHFRNRQIHVRKRLIKAEIGKDSSPRGSVTPLVVNGSTNMV